MSGSWFGDLWNFSNGTWSWIMGPGVANDNGVYGVKGVESEVT